MNSTRPTTQLDAVIIGAGIAGLYQLYRLREQGLKVKAVEAGDDVGGTWYWNRYPGARVDSPSHVYQYWFSKELNDEWNWSERFPAQPETERYLNFVADRFDLRKDIQFKTRVTAASYDEATKRWSLITDKDETFQAQYFISCAGMLSAPLMVQFAGQDEFKGRITGAPLAPAAALCNMTTCLQHQVDWITGCIGYLRAHGLTEIEPTRPTQDEWVKYHDDIANATLIVKTNSWYVGSNVAGKQRRMLSFAGGVGTYHQKCEELAIRGYPGFAMS